MYECYRSLGPKTRSRVFLDSRGAFDGVWWSSILHTLMTMNINETLFHLIRSYLHERVAVIPVNDRELQRKINIGCPQVSVLEPILWNITMNSLLNDIEAQKKRRQSPTQMTLETWIRG